MPLEIVPITIKKANRFVRDFHRHSKPTKGAKWAIGAGTEEGLQGVAIVGNPLSATLMDGLTAEVLRVCTMPGAPKGTGSKLYSRCWQIWRLMGGCRLVTYTLQTESGATLRGAGWKCVGEVEPGTWERIKQGRYRDWQPIYGQPKFRWEMKYGDQLDRPEPGREEADVSLPRRGEGGV